MSGDVITSLEMAPLAELRAVDAGPVLELERLPEPQQRNDQHWAMHRESVPREVHSRGW